ncbi:NAD(P)-binding protein [Hymenopellis radicata]|nr:NAD(P)-binding protein [Hymenopellis radicata]
MSSSLLAGRVALITGGGTGIGFAIARAFAAGGAKVYITGRRLEVLQKAAASVSGVTGSLVALQLDAVNEDSVKAAAAAVEAQDGKLDILVNNAGTNGPIQYNDKFMASKMAAADPFEPEYREAWVDVFNLNTIAPFFVTRAFTSLLTKGAQSRGKGATSSVINISSCGAVIRSQLTPVGYSISKAAVDQLTVVLATSFASRGVPIRVNAIQPGLFASELNENATDAALTEPLPGFVAPIPIERFATPEEMGSTATYLASTD